MASFDVKSLFTNIPIKETCNIILDKLFPHNDSIFEGFTSDLFKKNLDNCTNDNVFLFDKQLYVQRDGAPIGGCISPTLAYHNLAYHLSRFSLSRSGLSFLSYHEEKWLDNCPLEFKPIMYRRYVDDTFLLFFSCFTIS